MIKGIFIKKTKVIFTKTDEDFMDYSRKFVFDKRLLFGGLFFYGRMFDVFYPTCPHRILIICLSLIC